MSILKIPWLTRATSTLLREHVEEERRTMDVHWYGVGCGCVSAATPHMSPRTLPDILPALLPTPRGHCC